jgi:hypothetical protein
MAGTSPALTIDRDGLLSARLGIIRDTSIVAAVVFALPERGRSAQALLW